MEAIRRRRLLWLTGAVLGGGLAGCVGRTEEDGEDGDFLVSQAYLIHQETDQASFPEDVTVRVEFQNTTGERQEGTVVATLERTDGETVQESWEESASVSLPPRIVGSTDLVFESVFGPGDDIDDFRADATLEVDDPA